MKIRICLATAFLFSGCTHTPDPPEEVYICEARIDEENRRFSAQKFLDLEGEFKGRYSSPRFYEYSELNWNLNFPDKNLQASFISQPWESAAYNHEGNITLRVTPPSPVPVGTRVYLELAGVGRVFEGFPFNETRVSSSIWTKWPTFRAAIEGHDKAEFVFISPKGDIPHRIAVDLQPIYKAEKEQNALIAKIDQMAQQYQKACKREVLEYILVY